MLKALMVAGFFSYDYNCLLQDKGFLLTPFTALEIYRKALRDFKGLPDIQKRCMHFYYVH